MISYILLFLSSAWSTFVPWLFPVVLGYLFFMIDQSFNPWFILFWSTAWAMVWDTFLRYIDLHFIRALNWFYRLIRKEEKQFCKDSRHKAICDKKPTSRFWKLMKRTYLGIHKQENSLPLFAAVAFTAHVAIPDILIISLVREKKSYLFFMWAAFVGKFLLYASYIVWAVWIWSFFR